MRYDERESDNTVKSIHVFIAILFVFALSPLTSVGQVVSDPVAEFAEMYREPPDSIPAFAERHLLKIVHDFNNDGIDDIAISDSFLWGTAGGPWRIYLGLGKGKYSYLDDLFFDSDAIAFLPKRTGCAEIIVYIRNGGGKGDLIHYLISRKGIKKDASKTIYLNSDTKNADYKEYMTLFGRLSKSPIAVWCLLADYLENPNCPWKADH